MNNVFFGIFSGCQSQKNFAKLNVNQVDLVDSTYVQVELSHPELGRAGGTADCSLVNRASGAAATWDKVSLRAG